jgi:hypothetical protein
MATGSPTTKYAPGGRLTGTIFSVGFGNKMIPQKTAAQKLPFFV